MNTKTVMSESLSTIDAALAILNKFPDLDNIDLSLGLTISPLSYLMAILRNTKGYDIVVKILSSIIATGLPALELAVKAALISNMKNLINCNFNPMITDELLDNGIFVSRAAIDLFGTLNISPMDDKMGGRHFYFGCDGCNCADDVRDSAYGGRCADDGSWRPWNLSDSLFGVKDMNAQLWYIANHMGTREVWGRDIPLYEGADANSGQYDKQRRKDGVLTVEYCARPSDAKNLQGKECTLKVPGYNFIHVLLGNCAPAASDSIKAARAAKSQLNGLLKKLKKVRGKIESELKEANKVQDEFDVVDVTDKDFALDAQATLRSILNNNSEKYYDGKDYYSQYDIANGHYNNLDELQKSIQTQVDNLYKFFNVELNGKGFLRCLQIVEYNPPHNSVTTLEMAIGALRAHNNQPNAVNLTYRDRDLNYYHKRTLFHWNLDYVTSLKLFDEEVIVAQMLEVLTGSMSLSLGMSYQQKYLREEVKTIVRRLVNSDNVTISDCFFAFTDEQQRQLTKQAQMKYAGIPVSNDALLSYGGLSIEEMMSGIDDTSTSATGVKESSKIEGCLNMVTATRTDVVEESETNLSFSASNTIKDIMSADIGEQLMEALALAIAQSVLSPKVYLLFFVNQAVMGRNEEFSLEGFTEMLKNTLCAILREAVNWLIGKISEAVLKIIQEIGKEVAVKITLEQFEYYQKLMRKLLNCVNLALGKGDGLGFSIDQAVVDILDQAAEDDPDNNQCNNF